MSGWSFTNLARPHNSRSYNRAEESDSSARRSKNDVMMEAGLYKGSAVLVAGITGGVSAYKGLPEIKDFAGFDVLGGLALSGWEFWRLYKGKYGKATAIIGGSSTGLLCHWAAVNGTIWGATKAKADSSSDDTDTKMKGFDYSDDSHEQKQLNQDRSVKHETPSNKSASVKGGFDVFYGMA